MVRSISPSLANIALLVRENPVVEASCSLAAVQIE